MGNPHVLVIPFPAPGHAIPLMDLSQSFTKHNIKVTVVNSENYHKQVMKAFSEKGDIAGNQISFISIPDSLELRDDVDINQVGKLNKAFKEVMPRKLEELIVEINKSDGDEITCVVADMCMGWAFEVAAKMGIKRAAFSPSSACVLALGFSIQNLIDDGVIDRQGTPLKHEMVQLSPNMPPMNPANFVWACTSDLTTQKIILDMMINNAKAVKVADWIVCKAINDLEPAAFALSPQALPVGPLSASQRLGAFWTEDSTCLKWLDQHPPNSVVYASFGSTTVFDKTQFQELALGLELSGRPFLWVVRPDFTEGSDELSDPYPNGFLERVANRGQIVGWAPQTKVLSHPSVACFVSHCGWNSAMEGVCNGVPFLCWPYFADHFLNESYICDVWKVGLKFEKDERGIIPREEIKKKVEQVVGDESLKQRACNMKEMAMNDVKEGGCSYNNMKKLIEWIKA